MFEALPVSEENFRILVFFGVLGLMALIELLSPHRRQEIPRVIRWTNNFALIAIDTLLVRSVFPATAVSLAAMAAQNGIGVFHLLDMPVILAGLIGFFLLDLAIYGQHVLFHRVPFLWRLHAVHHADTECDATTALRFHPLEILLSMGIKIALVLALGIPPLAVLLFEVVLNAASLFNHANFAIPRRLDGILRLFVVTPDMHRIHHSVRREETDSNFGFSVTWWDRLFGTYRSEPSGGRNAIRIGLEENRTLRDHWIDRLLLQPLRGSRKSAKPGN